MNLEKNCEDVDQSTSKPKKIEETLGSQFALHVALQTMKERCQLLQKRLEGLEQENLRLRIENRRRKSDSLSNMEEPLSSKSELQRKIDTLEEKVAELQRSKSQLTHHLYMVATENKQLWSRLSHLTVANQNLGSHLSKISNTLSRHHSASSIISSKPQSPTNSLFQLTNKECSDDKEPDSPVKKISEGMSRTSLVLFIPFILYVFVKVNIIV